MKILIDASGRLLSMASDNPGWQVPPGGAINDSALTFADLTRLDAAVAALAVPGEIALVDGALVARARTLDAAQQEAYADDKEAQQAVAPLTNAIDGTAPTTVAQLWAILRPLLRVVRALVRMHQRRDR